MNIELTDRDIKEVEYLRRSLTATKARIEQQLVFLEGLQQRINGSAAPKREKINRSDKYRLRLVTGGKSKAV